MHPIGIPIVEIRVEIAVVQGGDGVTSLEDAVHRPARLLPAARCLGGAVGDDVVAARTAHPGGGEQDSGIGLDGVITEVVEPEENRHRMCSRGGQVEQQLEPGVRAGPGYPDRDLTPPRQSAEGDRVVGRFLPRGRRRPRHQAVHLGGELLEDLAAPLIAPGLCICNWFSVAINERVGQVVVWYLRLLVVGFFPEHGSSVRGPRGSSNPKTFSGVDVGGCIRYFHPQWVNLDGERDERPGNATVSLRPAGLPGN